MKRMKLVLAVVICCSLFFRDTALGQATSLKSLVKTGAMTVGIGALVDKFASPLNSFINTVTFQKGGKTTSATKVVPILSLGSGTHIGAVQVIGDKAQVDKTKAVMQIEANYNGTTFRIKALVPIDSKNVTKFKRVEGVGVSAVIDVKA